MFEDIFPPIRDPIPIPEGETTPDWGPCDDGSILDLTEAEIDALVEEMIDEFFDDLTTGGQL